MKKILILFLSLLFLPSCKTVKTTEMLVIASEKADCIGVSPTTCMQIKVEGQSSWRFFYDEIEGFNYEPGYEYVLQVEKRNIPNPPADRSSFQYVLVKEISKTAKQSENMIKLGGN
ncbi:MAG: hypothetical protein RL662_1562 [Bacteroidota bacterium]|jgi:hypothetical protein